MLNVLAYLCWLGALAHHFDSSWNWACQDALLIYYDIVSRCLATVDCGITVRAISLLNHADAELLKYMQYNIDH
jgi:fatty acid synthase subunit alpha